MRQVSRRSRPALLTVALLIGLALSAGGAAAATTNPANLGTSLAPSVPSDPPLHGVTAGSAPWVIKRSAFQLLPGGQVVVVIRGLVIPALGTPGPVTSVDAALYCGNETTPAATTQSVPLSAQGNALIVSRVTLPATHRSLRPPSVP